MDDPETNGAEPPVIVIDRRPFDTDGTERDVSFTYAYPTLRRRIAVAVIATLFVIGGSLYFLLEDIPLSCVFAPFSCDDIELITTVLVELLAGLLILLIWILAIAGRLLGARKKPIAGGFMSVQHPEVDDSS